jgi:predicted PurR-regulated permease PerM
MRFLDVIISWLVSAREWLYKAYLNTKGVWVIGDALSTPFYGLYLVFKYLAIAFGEFNEWVDAVAKWVSENLTWDNISQWFKEWRDKIVDAWNWFVDRFKWFAQEVNEWWNTIIDTIKGWIEYARQGLLDLWNELQEWVATIWEGVKTFFDWLPSIQEIWQWFCDWGGKILTLITGLGFIPMPIIVSLIDSWFLDHQGYWEGWQDVGGNVIKFITNPFTFLLDKFEDWFWGEETK